MGEGGGCGNKRALFGIFLFPLGRARGLGAAGKRS